MKQSSDRDRTAQAFYDDLAADYHLVFPDWEASVERHGQALHDVIRGHLGDAPVRVLDCTCGIGTQAIGLARRAAPTIDHVMGLEADGDWEFTVRRGRYRAVFRDELTEILVDQGLSSVKWLMPADSGFFQPMVAGLLA